MGKIFGSNLFDVGVRLDYLFFGKVEPLVRAAKNLRCAGATLFPPCTIEEEGITDCDVLKCGHV